METATRGCWNGNRKMSAILFLVDQVIAGVFVGPLCSFFWWGSWWIISRNFYPDNPELRAGICIAISNSGQLILLYTQDLWVKYVRREVWWQWLLGYHIYNAFLALCNVLHWMGVWTILDVYTGFDVRTAWTCYAIGQGMLIFLRCSKVAIGPPNIIVYNRMDNYFEYTTRFRIKRSFTMNFIYDSFITVIVIHQLIVIYWRGAWYVLDIYLYPESKFSTMLASLTITYTLMLIMCAGQPLINLLYRRLISVRFLAPYAELIRWLIDTGHHIVNNFTNVNMWRWVWTFSDLYVLPNDLNSGNGIAIAIGLGGLMIMCIGCSVTLKGVQLDGDLPDELVGYLPNFYLRIFYDNYLKWSKKKRTGKNLELNQNSDEFNRKREELNGNNERFNENDLNSKNSGKEENWEDMVNYCENNIAFVSDESLNSLQQISIVENNSEL